EEEVLPETSRRLEAIISALVNNGKIAPESRICFVNDGSKDKTWDIISRLYNENPIFAGLNLARNRGHQNALLAGLMFARKHADAVISLDADLQDDVAAIEKFVDEYLSGSDIVYGVRCSRSSDSFFKRSTAQNFYKLMKFMGVDIVYNHADYRLMSRRALDALSQFEEVNLFLRGIAPQIGFKTSTVEYVRAERFAGESKYPLKKMLAFAFEGITSFSVKPLRIATILGCGAFFISLIMLLYVLVQFFSGNTVSGWASLGVSIWALGGLQLLMTGIVGEYIGKVYLESKHRPRYIIESELLR
ncbi:MAG: glycosyltransferase family 2 protein, partial [Papillibacter sp.]|nr:glycosyltransferase family 2 protein [Papillibacter sp.]